MRYLFFIFIWLFGILSVFSQAAEQRFSWLPNDPNDFIPAVGYKIYCVSRIGTIVTDVGAGELIDGRVYGTVTGLDKLVPFGFYQCHVVAYSVEMAESDPSNFVHEKVLPDDSVITAIPGRAKY